MHLHIGITVIFPAECMCLYIQTGLKYGTPEVYLMESLQMISVPVKFRFYAIRILPTFFI